MSEFWHIPSPLYSCLQFCKNFACGCVEPTGSQPPERGGRAQGVRPEARTNNLYSHHSFGRLSVEPQDSCGRELAYSYQY